MSQVGAVSPCGWRPWYPSNRWRPVVAGSSLTPEALFLKQYDFFQIELVQKYAGQLESYMPLSAAREAPAEIVSGTRGSQATAVITPVLQPRFAKRGLLAMSLERSQQLIQRLPPRTREKIFVLAGLTFDDSLLGGYRHVRSNARLFLYQLDLERVVLLEKTGLPARER